MFPLDLHMLSNAVSRPARRNAKVALTLLSLTAGVLLVGQTRTTRTVEAERFVLKSADGSVRAKLEADGDATEFAFYNRAGKLRVAIKVAPDIDGLEMRDDTGRLLALVSVGLAENAPSSTTATIAVLGNKGGPGVILNATQDVASARVGDATGHSAWEVATSPRGPNP